MKLKTEIKVRTVGLFRQGFPAFDHKPVHYMRPLWAFSTVSLAALPHYSAIINDS